MGSGTYQSRFHIALGSMSTRGRATELSEPVFSRCNKIMHGEDPF